MNSWSKLLTSESLWKANIAKQDETSTPTALQFWESSLQSKFFNQPLIWKEVETGCHTGESVSIRQHPTFSPNQNSSYFLTYLTKDEPDIRIPIRPWYAGNIGFYFGMSEVSSNVCIWTWIWRSMCRQWTPKRHNSMFDIPWETLKSR